MKDNFALSGRNARWEKKIGMQEWEHYFFDEFGISIKDSANYSDYLHFEQIDRKTNFEVGKLSIPVKDIRTYFQLRSAYFSFSAMDHYFIRIIGKGYGHGVGLCQEGAKRMAQLGYQYDQIIHFYYKDVNIINSNQLK